MSVLVRDPTSHTCAAANGWGYPLSREGAALAHLYDLTVAANTNKSKRSKIKPYPRPWGDKEDQRSKKPTASQDTIRAALARVGHKGVS